MAVDAKAIAGVPIRPSTSAFADFEPLIALCKCWEQARGNNMIPTKQDFERAVLDYPEILPDLALAEFTSEERFNYIYMGSDRVFRRKQDHTGKGFEQAFAPRVRKFAMEWLRAGLTRPHINFWKDRTCLPSGKMAEGVNLSVILCNEEGLPTYYAAMTVIEKDFARELKKGGYLIGSDGLDMVPIDIGCGVPDLPRTVD